MNEIIDSIDPLSLIASLGLGYLVGSIPFAYLLVRWKSKIDIREIGSGNVGSTNVLRTGNKKLALATFIADLLKGFLFPYLLTHMHPANPQLAVVAAAGAVIGHIFPVWLSFSGGKGVATYLGTLFAIHPLVGFLCLGVWGIVLKIFKYSSLASITAVAMSFVFAWLDHDNWFHTSYALLLSCLIIGCHHQNIMRLIRKEEPKVGNKNKDIQNNSPNEE